MSVGISHRWDLSALYDGDPIKRHSIFLASELLVSPRGIVLSKCTTDLGLNKRWRGGGAEDAKDERAGRKGTFQSSDFPEYMGGKKCREEFFPRPESRRHLQMDSAVDSTYASSLHNDGASWVFRQSPGLFNPTCSLTQTFAHTRTPRTKICSQTCHGSL